MTSRGPDITTELVETEHRRLRALVTPDVDLAMRLHTPDFLLVHPGGGVWDRSDYLGGIADGSIDYRRFEPISAIEVMVDGTLAVVRYRSLIDIAVQGQPAGELRCWHVDCYQRNDAGWQVRWSQATEIRAAVPD